MEKCRLFGVIVPLSRWCGVRACELRNSPFGLLSGRVTSFSNRDGTCRAGVFPPNSRLHASSLMGSAAAPVAAPAVPMAPASAMPWPSRARRLIRPLPATGSSEGARPRRFESLTMILPGRTVTGAPRLSARTCCARARALSRRRSIDAGAARLHDAGEQRRLLTHIDLELVERERLRLAAHVGDDPGQVRLRHHLRDVVMQLAHDLARHTTRGEQHGPSIHD